MRWSIHVSSADDTIVRQVANHAGMSLNAYVARSAVAAAIDDLADRQTFPLSGEAWDELQAILDRPPVPAPRIAALLVEPSPLDAE